MWSLRIGGANLNRQCYFCRTAATRGSKARGCARTEYMIDWDDVRYLLAVAREGSVRAAAKRLEVNYSTVQRRVAQLEERLGAQMFDKLPSGYPVPVGNLIRLVREAESRKASVS